MKDTHEKVVSGKEVTLQTLRQSFPGASLTRRDDKDAIAITTEHPLGHVVTYIDLVPADFTHGVLSTVPARYGAGFYSFFTDENRVGSVVDTITSSHYESSQYLTDLCEVPWIPIAWGSTVSESLNQVFRKKDCHEHLSRNPDFVYAVDLIFRETRPGLSFRTLDVLTYAEQIAQAIVLCEQWDNQNAIQE